MRINNQSPHDRAFFLFVQCFLTAHRDITSDDAIKIHTVYAGTRYRSGISGQHPLKFKGKSFISHFRPRHCIHSAVKFPFYPSRGTA